MIERIATAEKQEQQLLCLVQNRSKKSGLQLCFLGFQCEVNMITIAADTEC